MNHSITYAVINSNNEVRRLSSSGGAFALLCGSYIKDGGCVIAPAMNSDGSVCFRVVDILEDLPAILGAKYVYCSCSSILKKLKQILDSGKKALFSGTPCQVAAARSFLAQEYDNLLLVDIICHGIPKTELWDSYRDALRRYYKREIEGVCFRDRTDGWRNYRLTVNFGDRVYSNYPGNDFYMTAFLRNYSLREGCYHCKTKGDKRSSDITLGDFWGGENFLRAEDFSAGAVLAVTHTEKGKQWIRIISSGNSVKEVPYDEALKKNRAYFDSALPPDDRDDFLAKFLRKTYNFKFAQRYFKRSWKQKLHAIVRNIQYSLRRKKQ